MDFFEFLFTELAVCSKPPNIDNYRKASYPRTQQRDQGTGGTPIIRGAETRGDGGIHPPQ